MTSHERPTIEDQQQLRDHFGQISPLAEKKVLQRLDRFCRDFIALSPFLVLATSDGKGNADASPRGDAPGFVAVLDDKTMLIPDRRGNNRIDSFQNIMDAPGVGLIFFVPGIDETLRVNGKATITQDTQFLAGLAARGVTPTIGMKISVDEAYFHCGKALMRSKLWDKAAQVERSAFPSLGRIISEQTAAITVEAAETAMIEAYSKRLY